LFDMQLVHAPDAEKKRAEKKQELLPFVVDPQLWTSRGATVAIDGIYGHSAGNLLKMVPCGTINSSGTFQTQF
jgi:hypothetical protein